MTHSIVKELYQSANGDGWALAKDSSGRLLVLHQPNQSSGGRPSEIGVDVFLSRGEQGPEHRALLHALQSLDPNDKPKTHQVLPVAATDMLSRALGKALGG